MIDYEKLESARLHDREVADILLIAKLTSEVILLQTCLDEAIRHITIQTAAHLQYVKAVRMKNAIAN